MIELTSALPGTPIIWCKLDEENEAGRTKCYPGETDLKQFTQAVMKHLEAKGSGQAGILMFDVKGTVHGLKNLRFPTLCSRCRGRQAQARPSWCRTHRY